MATVVKDRTVLRMPGGPAWLPLVALPAAAMTLFDLLPPWIFMWTLAVSIYAGGKWLTFARCPEAWRAPRWRAAGYLMLWPGMDARRFFETNATIRRPGLMESLAALAAVAVGVSLIFAAAPLAIARHPLLAGWLAMAGILFVLHYGAFHLLSLCWRRAGVDAPPIMQAPILSASLSEFWGRRWNLAFRDLAHTYVFRPLVGRLGIAGATLAAFAVSGVVHDLVITVPARGGWGLPTLYFTIQGLGRLFERSRVGRQMGLRGGWLGRLFCGAVILAPVGLLFPAPFIERIILPMLGAIRAI